HRVHAGLEALVRNPHTGCAAAGGVHGPRARGDSFVESQRIVARNRGPLLAVSGRRDYFAGGVNKLINKLIVARLLTPYRVGTTGDVHGTVLACGVLNRNLYLSPDIPGKTESKRAHVADTDAE